MYASVGSDATDPARRGLGGTIAANRVLRPLEPLLRFLVM
jgi:hypothetical protein